MHFGQSNVDTQRLARVWFSLTQQISWGRADFLRSVAAQGGGGAGGRIARSKILFGQGPFSSLFNMAGSGGLFGHISGSPNSKAKSREC